MSTRPASPATIQGMTVTAAGAPFKTIGVVHVVPPSADIVNLSWNVLASVYASYTLPALSTPTVGKSTLLAPGAAVCSATVGLLDGLITATLIPAERPIAR